MSEDNIFNGIKKDAFHSKTDLRIDSKTDIRIDDNNPIDNFPLTTSEAYHILSKFVDRNKNTRSSAYSIFKTTVEYTNKFGRIKDKNASDHLRSSLKGLGFSDNEIAIIGSLLPQTADDAKIIVPSITRLGDPIIESAILHIRDL